LTRQNRSAGFFESRCGLMDFFEDSSIMDSGLPFPCGWDLTITS